MNNERFGQQLYTLGTVVTTKLQIVANRITSLSLSLENEEISNHRLRLNEHSGNQGNTPSRRHTKDHGRSGREPGISRGNGGLQVSPWNPELLNCRL
jgi:hypothetical protein